MTATFFTDACLKPPLSPKPSGEAKNGSACIGIGFARIDGGHDGLRMMCDSQKGKA